MRTTWSAALAGNSEAMTRTASAAASAVPDTIHGDFFIATSSFAAAAWAAQRFQDWVGVHTASRTAI
jgi:hypothetical protein